MSGAELFGEQLRRIRLEKGISQRVLAEQIGIHHSLLWKWEADHATPAAAHLEPISRALGVPLDKFTIDWEINEVKGGSWATPSALKLGRELWDQGVSTLEIAARLHTTKNAIVGKAHRLHWPSRPSPIKRERTSKQKPIRNEARTLPDMFALLSIPRAPRVARPVRTYSPTKECQYLFGERHAWRFCGEKTKLGSSYCAEHHKLCHVRSEAV